MSPPPLLKLKTVLHYKMHYENHYCRRAIFTTNGIRVYFQPQKFGHAFYENSQRRKGPKDKFSVTRAERMDWIKATLEHPAAEFYIGWNKEDKCYEESRCVAVVFEDFVVIVEFSLDRKGILKANFITCYVADKNIDQVKNSPRWDINKCLEKLKKS